jgi:hypothetical protein
MADVLLTKTVGIVVGNNALHARDNQTNAGRKRDEGNRGSRELRVPGILGGIGFYSGT